MLKPLPSLLLLLSAVLLCQQAQGIDVPDSPGAYEWQVEGDQFECRLSQPIHQFGTGEFVRRAGEQGDLSSAQSGGAGLPREVPPCWLRPHPGRHSAVT